MNLRYTLRNYHYLIDCTAMTPEGARKVYDQRMHPTISLTSFFSNLAPMHYSSPMVNPNFPRCSVRRLGVK